MAKKRAKKRAVAVEEEEAFRVRGKGGKLKGKIRTEPGTIARGNR